VRIEPVPPPARPHGSTVRSLLLLAWIAATLALATGWGASTRTKAWLAPRLVEAGLAPETAAVAHRVLRKLGHVAAYAVCAWLAYAALRGRPRRAQGALGAAFALALLDESVQSVSPGRGGSPLDVLLDVAAAALALALVLRGGRASPVAAAPRPGVTPPPAPP
jgi:VanZ family protein